MNLAQHLAPLRAATIGAQQRTGDKAICTAVKSARIQVQRITWPNGSRKAPKVEPLSEYLPMADAIAFLDKM